jgi:hypothetical protein
VAILLLEEVDLLEVSTHAASAPSYKLARHGIPVEVLALVIPAIARVVYVLVLSCSLSTRDSTVRRAHCTHRPEVGEEDLSRVGFYVRESIEDVSVEDSERERR